MLQSFFFFKALIAALCVKLSSPAQSYEEENEPKRKSILYEDLRLKNRENYEVTLTQKAESLLKTSPEKEPERPTKSGTKKTKSVTPVFFFFFYKKETVDSLISLHVSAKNIYGDAWEE